MKRTDTLFVDQADSMERTSRYFNDPCHFTAYGSGKFVGRMLRVALLVFKENKPAVNAE